MFTKKAWSPVFGTCGVVAYALIALLLIGATTAIANDRAVVEAFYSRVMSRSTAPDLRKQVLRVLAKDWVSIPAPVHGKGREGFIKSLQRLGTLIPNLKWQPQEILLSGKRYIVRSTVTGKPVKTFMGVRPKGRSFKIIGIDIHTVRNGRIVRSYHVEEWSEAIWQLMGNSRRK